MKLDVGCTMGFQALWATPAILMLRPRSGEGQWVLAERYLITPEVPISEFTDAHGNLCQRIVVPDGPMTISIEATVDTADEIDVDMTAPRVPIEEVPDWALQFLLPSRYCQSDMVFQQAISITGNALPGYPQVEAIRSWIEREVTYEYNTSSASTSAVDTLESRKGVCRDFAHLGIALCRSLDIPARMVVGYLHELDPMDLHAWFEAYVGGRWFTFDATQRFPKGNRVSVAYGRDAADVALVTQFGPLEMLTMEVHVRPTQEPMYTDGVTSSEATLTSRPMNLGPDVTTTPQWAALLATPQPPHLRELFAADPGRAERYLLHVGDLRVDHAKQRVDDDVMAALLAVADAAGVEARRDAMFAGEPINVTEDRPVLHVALRAPAGAVIEVDGEDVVPEVHEVLRPGPPSPSRSATGGGRAPPGERIRTIVNIGIGGSDLGPAMAYQALPRSATPRSRPASCPTSTAPTSPARSRASTPPRRCSSCRRRRSPRWRR